MTLKCAIYCTVIDNFGDVGVCWRLARQLAEEHDVQVTLWIDDLLSFSKLEPNIDLRVAEQKSDQITVCLWHKDDRDGLSQIHQTPLDILIEGFGCRIPNFVLENMAKQAHAGQPQLWINLEYLSAESWATNCHLMPSVHPQTGLVQFFWFPSFSEKSGGLLRETELLKKRDYFQNSINEQAAFWSQLNIQNSDQFDRRISLFSYENRTIHILLNNLANDKKNTLLLVPEGKALADISDWANVPMIKRSCITKGALTILVLPFLNHQDYDRLLWTCDLNFVRGEDSFIRAQWAGKPFIWHIYPQDDDAHLIKLNAFIDSVSIIHQDSLWQQAMLAWNALDQEYDWSKAMNHLSEWQQMTQEWQHYLSAQPNLTTKLMQFYHQNTSRSDE